MATKAKTVKSAALVKAPAKVVKTKATKQLSKFNFQYTFEFTTPKGRKVVHNLIRKQGEYNSATVGDRLKQLAKPENTKWHSVVKKWKRDIKKGDCVKPDRTLRVQFANVLIKDLTIDDDIQRDLDCDWVASIANPKEFKVEYMSPIQCIYDPVLKKFISINAQHTVVLEAAFAVNDLWEGFAGDPLELTVPVAFVVTSNRATARMAFRIFNGKSQKKIEPYVDHRCLVFTNRVDGSSDREAGLAAAIQAINEAEGFEPIPSTDKKNSDAPWAIVCVKEMQQHYNKPERWKFILNTHMRYFPNIQLDIMECDLYGFMYEYFTELGDDVYSAEFRTDFLDSAMAIIQEFFITPHRFGADSKNTQIRFQAMKYARSINSKDNKVEDEGSFIYLMKLYRFFGGQHVLPVVVDNMNEPGRKEVGDLLNHVDDVHLVEEMVAYGKP